MTSADDVALDEILNSEGTRRAWGATLTMLTGSLALHDLASSASSLPGTDGIARSTLDLMESLPGISTDFRNQLRSAMTLESLTAMEDGYREGQFGKHVGADDPALEVAKLIDKGLGPSEAIDFIHAVQVHGARATLGKRADQLQFEAVLVLAVSVLEMFLAGIAEAFYLQVPQALRGDEKILSLDELAAATDLHDLRQLVAARRARRMMSGSADDWANWFEARLGVRLQDLSSEWLSLNEALERRHVLVHNNGLVDEHYLANTGRRDVSVGSVLSTDHPYVIAFLAQVLATSMGLAVVWWAKLASQELKTTHALVLLALFGLEERQLWSSCAGIGLAVLKASGLPDDMRRSIQLRTWNALKRSEGVNRIRDEVVSKKMKSSDPEDPLLRAALLDDLDEAFSILPDLLERKTVTVVRVASDSIFADVVRDPRWPEIVRRFIPAADPDWSATY
jgi:hypothetical protein